MRNKILLLAIFGYFLNFSMPIVCGKKNKHRIDRARSDVSEQLFVQNEEQCISMAGDLQTNVYNVRVLLSEQNMLDGQWRWELESSAGFFLADSLSSTNRMQSDRSKVLISFKDGSFYLNDKRMWQKEFVFRPRSGYLIFQNSAYDGNFLITIDEKQGRCCLINSLDLEDYVCSVLKSEGWPGWPLEINKVLAITSRTYALAMMKAARECKRVYDVKSTNAHQTYRGVHAQQLLKKAVDDTKGLFVSYSGSPIVAMFDVCCGGVVPANIAGFNFERAPYLARSYACQHCKDCSSYSWSFSVEKPDMIAFLQKEYPQLTTLRELKITKKDKAGLVLEVLAKGVRTTLTVTGKKLYSAFKGIKSYCFGVQKKGSVITFSGRGFGHHIGLCQWGARAMVRDGWDYRSILVFYYPQTKLMKLA